MYKTIFILIALAFANISTEKVEKAADNGRGIRFIPGTEWKYATKMAKKEGKPIFAMVCAPWCSKCNQMKASVFTDPDVGNFFNEKFVCVMMNSEDTRTNIRVTGWGVKAVPTLVFLDQNKKVVYEVAGFRDSRRLLEAAQKALSDM